MVQSAIKDDRLLPVQRLIETAAKGRFVPFNAQSLTALKERGFSTDEIHRFVAPRRTLARRIEKDEPLTLAENDSALRLIRIVDLAERVLDGQERAQRWLRKPSRALNTVTPIDLLESETGARLVEEELLRIDHGMFA